jgi:galactokinase
MKHVALASVIHFSRALYNFTLSCLSKEIYKRALHVVMENERVQASAKYLCAGDVRRFGEAMKQSHESLRDLYEVSGRELDVMVEIAEGLPG